MEAAENFRTSTMDANVESIRKEARPEVFEDIADEAAVAFPSAENKQWLCMRLHSGTIN